MEENCGEGLWLNGYFGDHLCAEPTARLKATKILSFSFVLIRDRRT
jgi:hypothetical protein